MSLGPTKKAQILHPSAIMRGQPDFSSETSNELLFGETVEILGQTNDFYEVQADHDDYVGCVHEAALGTDIFVPTHAVSALGAYLYSAPDFKSPPLGSLPFESKIQITDQSENGFILTAHDGWVFEKDLRPLDGPAYDHIKTAEMFLHSPYLWGGRTAAGLDCSALVQLSLMAANIPCPRDTEEQQDMIGQPVPFQTAEDLKTLQRGDIVYFPGHVGMMSEPTKILNATSRHMRVVIEDLFELIGIYGAITSVRRITQQDEE